MSKQKLALVLSGLALTLAAGAASAHGGYDPYWKQVPDRTTHQPVAAAQGETDKPSSQFDWVDRYAPA
jgi:hypothetical protein